MTDWTDELRAKVVKEYLDAKPTPETNTEIIEKIASGLEDSTVNGVRAVLIRAKHPETGEGIYVKSSGTPAKEKKNGEGTRVSKAEAIAALKSIISNNQLEVDDAIIDKLTGKAAQYFTGILTELTQTEAEE